MDASAGTGLQWKRLAVLVALAVFVLSGCGGRQRGSGLRLSDVEPTEQPSPAFRAPTGVLRLAVAPVYSPRKTFQIYRDLAAYLGRATGLRPEVIQGKTYAEINDLIRTGDVTTAVVCTNAYIEGQEDFGMEAIAIPVVGGETVYYSYLIVPRESDARRLDDLRGRTFAFTDPLSNSGRLTVVYRLQEMGEGPDAFFRRYIFTYSHDNSIQAVVRKVVDGAAVDSQVYDYAASEDPSIAARTRIIARWGPYGINPIVVYPRLNPTVKRQLRQTFLTMHQNPDGRDILRRLAIDRFAEPDDRIYESVRAMRARVKGRAVTRP